MTPRWYLVHTKVAGEAIAQANLDRQGYRVHWPRLLRPAHHRGRWVDRIVALFPRYLFVQLDAGRQEFGPVRSTLGVASIVRFGHDYAVVPDRVIENLLSRADPVTGLHRLSFDAPIQPGSKVRIVAGAFDGLEGVFQRNAGNERVHVLLELLGRSAPVRVPASFVVPQSSAFQHAVR